MGTLSLLRHSFWPRDWTCSAALQADPLPFEPSLYADCSSCLACSSLSCKMKGLLWALRSLPVLKLLWFSDYKSLEPVIHDSKFRLKTQFFRLSAWSIWWPVKRSMLGDAWLSCLVNLLKMLSVDGQGSQTSRQTHQSFAVFWIVCVVYPFVLTGSYEITGVLMLLKMGWGFLPYTDICKQMPDEEFHWIKKTCCLSPFRGVTYADRSQPQAPSLHVLFPVVAVFVLSWLAVRSEVIMTLLFLSQALLMVDTSLGEIKMSWWKTYLDRCPQSGLYQLTCS